LTSPNLDLLSSKGTAIAHCPLSNAYFSAKPFPLREALDRGVKVGLGTDIAGGYSIDIKSAMRQAVIVSRMREGARLESEGHSNTENLSVDWKETLFMATRGGALALGKKGYSGLFEVGAAFDAQHSRHISFSILGVLTIISHSFSS
jgi:guanine deaminase